MPQIERPNYRAPLRDLPLSLFIHPEHMKPVSLLGKKRPYSPSSAVSPSKRRLLAVEGVLSPRSPFKKAVADLHRALPSASPAGRNLYAEFQKPSQPSTSVKRQPPLALPLNPASKATTKPTNTLLAPSLEISANQPKPKVAPGPSKAEADLLALLAAAPKPTHDYFPGAGQSRPKRNKEDDPEEDHYPGFDICEEVDSQADMNEHNDEQPRQSHKEDLGEEEDAKENQPPHDENMNYRFSTPLSTRSSMSSLGAPRYGRSRLQREVDDDAFSSDDELL
ncbi:hypothetical protein CPB86DRAFT_714780 [Serendipita vermifera]|nr:hypothetical protein CPB86DRAFT_714780 [Serendipita vermifera]